jgi:flagellar biosynthesis protein FliQ
MNPRRARLRLLPTTWLGWWAVRLMVAFAVLFLVGVSLVAAGEKSAGDAAFDSLWLTVPLTGVGLTAVLAGVLAGVAAAFAIVRRGERSTFVFLPLIVGLLVALFLLGEIVSPH